MRIRSTLVAGLGAALVAAGCGGGGGGAPAASSEPAATPTVAGTLPTDTPPQRRALEAQTSGPAAGPAPGAEALAAELERTMKLKLERTAEDGYTLLTPVTTDDAGDPLPGADAALARYGSFTIAVSSDARKLVDVGGPGDLVPMERPESTGIVWVKGRDALGEETFDAYTFFASGRAMMAWTAESGDVDVRYVRLVHAIRRALGEPLE